MMSDASRSGSRSPPSPRERLWQATLRLISLGVDKTSDRVLQRKIVLANAYAFVALLMSLISTLGYLPSVVDGLSASGRWISAATPLFLCVWWLNARGHALAARLAVFAVSALVLLGSIAAGQGSLLMSHAGFILLTLVAAALFRLSEWRLSGAVMLANFAAFYVIDTVGWPAAPSIAALPPAVIERLQVAKIGINVFILMAVMLSAEFAMHDHVRLLAAQGRRDPLTGLRNRRRFMELLRSALAARARTDVQLAVALIDVDHFKAINDRLGHEAGDQVLVHLAQRLQTLVGEGDVLARLGGEEFVVLMRVRDAAEALVAAERLRQGVAADHLEALGLPGMTISVGLSVHAPGMSLTRLLRNADRAMYQAKQGGRNRVVLDREQGLPLPQAAGQTA